MNYRIENINSWKEFKEFASCLTDSWVFRGQSDSTWELKTSYERSDFYNKYDAIELTFLIDFQKAVNNFIDFIPNHLIDWLSLMQHHEAPTRLLDFTKSPFIATYFAFEEKKNVEKIAIWAIDTVSIYKHNLIYLNDIYSELLSKFNNQISDELFIEIFNANDDYTNCIIQLDPFKMNKRLYLQQGTFLSPANTKCSFMEQLQFLETEIADKVIKIEIPSSIRTEALKDLSFMNINSATLYPDLDGYSKSLAMKYNIMDDITTKLSNRINEYNVLKK